MSFYVIQDNVWIWYTSTCTNQKVVTMFVYFPIIYLQVSKMKAIIFILVAATILSACDGCPLYLRKNWCHCFCSDMYSSCQNRCPGNGLWRIMCLNQCVKHYSYCSGNCRRRQGWMRIGLNICKEKNRQTKKDPMM